MMLELSPLETAAKAYASAIPARWSTSRSKPCPVTFLPENEGRSLRNARSSWSIIATVCPESSRACARVIPTLPTPMITKCAMGDSIGPPRDKHRPRD